MSSELYQQRIFDQSSLTSGLPKPQMQPYLFPAAAATPTAFPPVAPDTTENSNIHSRAFQPFLRDQNQSSQYETRDETSAHMEEEDNEYIEVASHEEEGPVDSTVSPMAPFFEGSADSNEPSLDERIGSSTSDMYSRMRQVQLNHLPKYQPNSAYIKYRRYLVDWLAETSEELRFKTATVHVAASFLDRVLIKANDTSAGGRCSIPKHLWQLVAMVCLRIAGKFEEREEDVTGDGNGMLVLANGRRISAVEAFTRHLGDAAMMVTSSQIKEWEIFVLENLGWNLSTITPVHCLSYYEASGVVFVDDSWNGRPLIEKIPRYIKKYNDFFANLCLQDYFYAQFSPSHLAASILYASRHALSLTPLWRPELETLTGHSSEEVHEVFSHIWKYYADTFPSHARKSTASPKGIEEVDAI